MDNRLNRILQVFEGDDNEIVIKTMEKIIRDLGAIDKKIKSLRDCQNKTEQNLRTITRRLYLIEQTTLIDEWLHDELLETSTIEETNELPLSRVLELGDD